MKTTGLFFFMFVCISAFGTEPLFKYQYMRLASGSCAKCTFSAKMFNQIKDEFKPVVIFPEDEKALYKSDLVVNGMENWPADKLAFSDSLAAQFPGDSLGFGVLYLANDGTQPQKIMLDMSFNPSWLNVVNMELRPSEVMLNEGVMLGRHVLFNAMSDKKVIHNTQTKTIYFIKRENTIEIKLDERLKFDIVKPYLRDSQSIITYQKGVFLLQENNIDMSEFCSITTSGDTLVVLTNVSHIRFLPKVSRVWRSQFLCKFVEGKLVSSTRLKEIKQHITFDEYGHGDIFYRNDSLYIRMNKYDRKDRMMIKDHLALMLVRDNEYCLSKTYNLEIPLPLLDKSTEMIDYANGSFYNSTKAPDYFFYNLPAVYEQQSNIVLPIDPFIQGKDTGMVLSAMKLHEFTVLLVSSNKGSNAYQLVFILDGKLLRRSIELVRQEYPNVLNGKGVTSLDIENRKLIEVAFVPVKFIKDR